MGEWSVFIFQVSTHTARFYVSQYSVTEGDAKAEIKQHMRDTGWMGVDSSKFVLVKEYDTIGNTDIDELTTPFIMVGGIN